MGTEPEPSVNSQGNAAWFLATLVFILALTVYVATMCRTVYWWDTGELAANARILGIAHRPGFPLYILIGRLFGMVHFGDFFYRINFVSALSAAIALAMIAHFAARWLTLGQMKSEARSTFVAVVLATVAIGGTYTLWMQSVRAEVYAPTLLVLTILLACARRFEHDIALGGSGTRWLCAAAFVGGLGFGLHNATIASVAPAFALFFFTQNKGHRGLSGWTVAGLLAILGLSINLYLPIRGMQSPALNWGWAPMTHSPGWGGVVAVDSWRSIITVSLGGWLSRVQMSAQLLFDQLELGLILFVLLGAVEIWRRSRRWFVLLFGIVLGNIAMTALLATEFSETNADVHGYLLPALAVYGISLAAGLVFATGLLRRLLERRMPSLRLRPFLLSVSLALVVFLILAPAIINSPYCNLVDHHLAYDFGTESTLELKPGAVILLAGTNWDFVLRGLQYCDDWRTDLRVLNRDLLPAAWYRQWAHERFPDLQIESIPTDDKGLDCERWAIQLAERGIPVYWEFTEINLSLVTHLLPAGHLFEVSAEEVPKLDPSLVEAQEDFESRSRFYGNSKRILYDYDAQMVYVANLYRAGIYYESRGYFGRARELLRRALSLGQDTDETSNTRQHLPPGPWMGLTDSVNVPAPPAPLDRIEQSR